MWNKAVASLLKKIEGSKAFSDIKSSIDKYIHSIIAKEGKKIKADAEKVLDKKLELTTSSLAKVIERLNKPDDIYYEYFFTEEDCDAIVFSEKGILIAQPRYSGNKELYPQLFSIYINGVRQTYCKEDEMDCKIIVNKARDVVISFPQILEADTFVEIYAKKKIDILKD